MKDIRFMFEKYPDFQAMTLISLLTPHLLFACVYVTYVFPLESNEKSTYGLYAAVFFRHAQKTPHGPENFQKISGKV